MEFQPVCEAPRYVPITPVKEDDTPTKSLYLVPTQYCSSSGEDDLSERFSSFDHSMAAAMNADRNVYGEWYGYPEMMPAYQPYVPGYYMGPAGLIASPPGIAGHSLAGYPHQHGVSPFYMMPSPSSSVGGWVSIQSSPRFHRTPRPYKRRVATRSNNRTGKN